ncbi:DUF1840 domain-containing protein [Photobacterium gaetbulicola]|uniref:DUF1840 domain-containing protein n=1 Tax=Photobacterium gaetbulicola Gung47 TaxID=658445 RepID=A0A0C5WII0_9GAMM|nr:DUF1840 domain-containing protein [Photobacterium gaetbulicola]AJR05972.1 hypothetical protein H744_1c0947 [Photobacterium gaetbulicola Gung47]PSU13221.1 DUF1840 domain-containing protein [Photobacterium gaetbulicola]
MLVTFKCKVHGNVVMFGDVAKQMLRFMGHCENIPGALDPQDIDDALCRLTSEINKLHQLELKAADEDAGDVDDVAELDMEPVISLHTRATPLIEMLQAAKKADCHVMWQEGC